MLSRRSLLTNSIATLGAGAVAQAGAQVQPSPIRPAKKKVSIRQNAGNRLQDSRRF